MSVYAWIRFVYAKSDLLEILGNTADVLAPT
jgi:hypothetical protein